MPEYITVNSERVNAQDALLDSYWNLMKERDELFAENVQLRAENDTLRYLKGDFEAAIRTYLHIGEGG